MTKRVFLYTDGGARGNPGPAAIGVVLKDENGVVLKAYKKHIGSATNNVAEYTALVKGLALALAHGTKEIICYTDSELMMKQLIGEYKVRALHLKALYDVIKSEEEKFDKITYKHVRRSHPDITYADALVNEALDRR